MSTNAAVLVATSENWFRAITYPDWWKEDENRPTSAAFKDSNGASVDVQGERDIPSSTSALVERFPGLSAVVYLGINEGTRLGVTPVLEPLEGNPYHSILKMNDKTFPISTPVAKKLSKAVSISYQKAAMVAPAVSSASISVSKDNVIAPSSVSEAIVNAEGNKSNPTAKSKIDWVKVIAFITIITVVIIGVYKACNS